MLSRRREKDLVHWGAHRLDDFLRDVVEPDHLFPLALLSFSLHAVSPRLVPFSLSPSLFPLHLINNRRSPASRGLDPRPASPGLPSLFWYTRLIRLSRLLIGQRHPPDSLLHLLVMFNATKAGKRPSSFPLSALTLANLRSVSSRQAFQTLLRDRTRPSSQALRWPEGPGQNLHKRLL
jgi:hypothetical protein